MHDSSRIDERARRDIAPLPHVALPETDPVFIRTSRNNMGAQMALGDLEQLVMLALLRLGDDGFGAAVQREIAERSGRDVTLGAVYTALARLEEKGFVASYVGDPLPQRGGRRRRHYEVRPEGRAAIAEAWRAMKALSRGLSTQLEG